MEVRYTTIDVRIRVPIGGFEGEQGGLYPSQISTVPPRMVVFVSEAHYEHV